MCENVVAITKTCESSQCVSGWHSQWTTLLLHGNFLFVLQFNSTSHTKLKILFHSELWKDFIFMFSSQSLCWSCSVVLPVLMYAEMFPMLKCIFLDRGNIWIKMQPIHARLYKGNMERGCFKIQNSYLLLSVN